ncbi:disulfide bond formation protein B [Stappia sp. 28M-7]|uniref:disulfide bond formation protein B n=1 Tax=Stappia sp. 28M-7 TaxID=2762596 RepID=UPI000E7426F4|nr:disulfide bond formation protein B [Stappia sp. 28M-7]MBC2861286.1 disulfide bond formation protein B [Stappia sp. 28M-7]
MSDPARTSRQLVMLLIAGGLASILTAWGFQLIGGYVPCKLCLEQRIPYYVGLPLALLALLVMLRGTPAQGRLVVTVLLLAVAAVFAWGAGIGAYQAGAEWGFWAGPADCGGGGGMPDSAANMLNALRSTRVVSCTEASWRMFGLSFAGWNAVISAGVAVLALAGAWAWRRGSAA